MKKLMVLLISLLMISSVTAMPVMEDSEQTNQLDISKLKEKPSTDVKATKSISTSSSRPERNIKNCDFNGDGVANLTDTIYLTEVISWYTERDSRFDLNGDEIVNLTDVAIFSQSMKKEKWCHATFWSYLEEPEVEEEVVEEESKTGTGVWIGRISAQSENTEENIEITENTQESIPTQEKRNLFEVIAGKLISTFNGFNWGPINLLFIPA